MVYNYSKALKILVQILYLNLNTGNNQSQITIKNQPIRNQEPLNQRFELASSVSIDD